MNNNNTNIKIVSEMFSLTTHDEDNSDEKINKVPIITDEKGQGLLTSDDEDNDE